MDQCLFFFSFHFAAMFVLIMFDNWEGAFAHGKVCLRYHLVNISFLDGDVWTVNLFIGCTVYCECVTWWHLVASLGAYLKQTCKILKQTTWNKYYARKSINIGVRAGCKTLSLGSLGQVFLLLLTLVTVCCYKMQHNWRDVSQNNLLFPFSLTLCILYSHWTVYKWCHTTVLRDLVWSLLSRGRRSYRRVLDFN